MANTYLGKPIEGVLNYRVVELSGDDRVTQLAGPLPWVVASLEASYLAHLYPSADIEIWADDRCDVRNCTICLPR